MISKYNKKRIPLEGWEREEQFNFFRTFTQPFFNVHTQVDLTPLHRFCRQENTSVFLAYLYATLQAARATENFRLRLENGQVVLYEGLDLSTTVLKDNHTIAFVSLPHQDSLPAFCAHARALIDDAKKSKDVFIGHQGPDLLHMTTLPWFPFKGMEHATSVNPQEAGVPKIAFGRIEVHAEKVTLPMSIALHHALADGYHLHLFLEQLNAVICSME
ncbi:MULTISPECIES: CatA-like O-acetyltransferase [Rufibacter]|uniref:Chloramphenicol O-acetyltransferase type A n=1 Tax=Rufibacter quisquiliarum TaxID=1549639 RepID=A0A839GMR8_9BACT|nr:MULTISPECIES: CatA-like O-acetyltransferase [Rufibacter]MBA9079193.1 chloramphenicol O-acetyltransferase type A [Rufibacter quisquiliarum]